MKAREFTVADVRAVVDRLGEQLGRAEPTTVTLREHHSNRVAEVEFDTGRTLIIKQSRYQEMSARFETSRSAARLLRHRSKVPAPEYLDVPGPEASTILAYWRIPLPTLRSLWPRLQAQARRHTLHTWGSLIRRIQQARLPGHGALPEAEQRTRSLAEFVRGDLQQRLRPAAEGEWPAALATIDDMSAKAEGLQARVGDAGAVLIHNDLFAANVLCEETPGGEVLCVGVIDLEDAFAGPPEAEFAKIEVLHGPLFGKARDESFMQDIVAGYGASLDPVITAYFRVVHLLNMGFHAAAIGLEAHAADVLSSCRLELGRMG